MVGLSILLMASSFRRRASDSTNPVDWHEVGRALIAWGALAACVALLKLLGFVLAFGLFTFFLVAMMFRRSLGTAAAVSVGVSIGFYLVFPLALNVALPIGKLGF